MTSSLEPLMGIRPNFTGMIPGWSPINVAQTRFLNAIFKNLV